MRTVLSGLLMIGLLQACSGTNSETLSANELAVERFVRSITNYDTIIVANRVSYVRVTAGDMDERLSAGDSVYFYFAARTLTDSVPYETNVRAVAEHYGMDMTIRNFDILGAVLGGGDLIEGLDAGLQLGHVGDHAYIVFNSDRGYGSKPMGIVRPNSPLFFEVWIEGKRANY